MTRPSYILATLFCIFISSCTYVLDEPELSAERSGGEQQSIEVIIKPLTSDAVEILNSDEYKQELIVPNKDKYKLAAGESRFSINPLPTTNPITYKIGVGDLIELTTIVHNTNDGQAYLRSNTNSLLTESGNTLEYDYGVNASISRTSSRVGADGSLLFIETGRLEVAHKTLAEIRDLVNDALIRKGEDPRFQLEVRDFKSQSVGLVSYVTTINNQNIQSQIKSALYPITEKPLTLRELLIEAGLILSDVVVQVISIQRNNKTYQMTLKHVFDESTPEYYLLGGDYITLEAFGYKNGHAYVLGGLSNPILLPVSENNPVKLASALFAGGGILSSRASKKSEVYLLRGKDPVIAYHLDATNPVRLTLSSELELRPDDIVFASTVPIVDFNTVLGLVNPLRVLTGQEQPLFAPAF